MTVTIGTVLRAVVTLDMPGGNVAQNVFYLRLGGVSPITDIEAETQVIDYVENFYAQIEDQISQDVDLRDVAINEYDPDVGVGWETGRWVGGGTLTDAFVGGISMWPHAVAAIITGFVEDPKVRSRKSIPGFVESAEDDSILSAPAIADMVLAAVEWITSWTWLGTEYLEPGVPAQLGVWMPLITALVSAVVGSQRRRKPGVGI